MTRQAWLLGCWAALSGCAAASVTPEFSAAEEAIRNADQVDAAADARAAVYLTLARNELQAAHRRLGAGDESAASGLAQRARADADLAAILALESGARDAARRTAEHADALSRALDRGPR